MIGVLNDGLLLTNQGEKRIRLPDGQAWDCLLDWNLGRLFQFCKANHLTKLWINKGSDFWRSLKRSAEHFNECNVSYDCPWFCKKQFAAPGWTVRPEGKISNLLTAWDESGYRVAINFPGMIEESWEFDRVEDPYTLFLAVREFTETLDTDPTYPQRAAREVFEKSIKINIPLLTDEPDSFWQVFSDKMETEFIWLHKLTKADRKFKYVHAFDKRMMFLSAARGAMFGLTYPEEVQNISYSDIKDAVGLVKLKKHKFENSLNKSIPGFFKELFGNEQYFYTPYLSVFQGKFESYVNDLTIEKGFIWRNPIRLFEKFSKQLGDAVKATRRDAFPGGVQLPEHAIVNSAYKHLYTRFFGWLGRIDSAKRVGYKAELFRPDWRGLIVSSAGANLLRNIIAVHRDTQTLPIGINHDALLYLSDEPDAKLAFLGTDLTDRNKFTHEWTANAAEVFELIDAGKNVTQICSYYKKQEFGGE